MADDRERFERIYRENFRAVLRFAALRIDPERAKDVAAETFLVAWRRFDDVPAEPRAWLLGVARKVIAGQFRTETRRDALAARLAANGQPEAFDPAMALESADVVAQNILWDMRKFVGLTKRADDVTMIVAKVM